MNKSALLSSTVIPSDTPMEARIVQYASLWHGNTLIAQSPIDDRGYTRFMNVPLTGARLTMTYLKT